VFDPVGHRYLSWLVWQRVGSPPRWNLQSFPPDEAIYADPDRVLLFSTDGASLRVQEGKDRADSIDDAEARALRASLPVVRRDPIVRSTPTTAGIDFARYFLGRPVCPEGSATNVCETKIESVTHVNGEWVLVLASERRAEIRLTEDFKYEAVISLGK
jgi:hypothetical protein